MQLVAAAMLGLGLGIRHAFEADHVAALSTFATRESSAARSARAGLMWGLGHGTTILVAGTALAVFEIAMPPQVALALEFMVGLLLVGLGVSLFMRTRADRARQVGQVHTDPTSSHHLLLDGPTQVVGLDACSEPTPVASDNSNGLAPPPDVSVVHPPHAGGVGILHGAAGTGALVVLASAHDNAAHAMMFLAMFGVASTLAMGGFAGFLTWSIGRAAGRAGRSSAGLIRAIRITSAAISVAVGLSLLVTVGAHWTV